MVVVWGGCTEEEGGGGEVGALGRRGEGRIWGWGEGEEVGVWWGCLKEGQQKQLRLGRWQDWYSYQEVEGT